MRSLTVLIVAALLCLAAQRTFAAVPTADDVNRAIAMVYTGDAGAAGGDVNADGRAGAADVAGTLLGMQSPTQLGPYGSGIRRMTFTKPSATHPEESRVLDKTDIWYPAAPGTWKTDIRPGAQFNVPVAQGLSHLPLILFSHGSCGFQEQSIFLMRRLATWGFVVASPPHPGNTTSDFATCETAEEIADSFVNRPADIRFVIDQLLALNNDSTSFLHGLIDPERIGMSGHSFGGLTTLRVTAMDSRIVAGLALAPVVSSISNEVAQIAVPMMIQVGTFDGLHDQGQSGYGLLKAPRYLVEIERMTHSPFSDFCLECTPNSLTVDEAHLFALRYAIPFVLHYVAHDGRFDAFLTPASAPTGVVLTEDVGESALAPAFSALEMMAGASSHRSP